MILDKEKIIKTTIALYEVTKSFPEKEPLKYQIRETANRILCGIIGLAPEKSEQTRILSRIEAMLALFRVAEVQKWVNEKNFSVLERYYKEISQDLKRYFEELAQKQENEPPQVINLPPREKAFPWPQQRQKPAESRAKTKKESPKPKKNPVKFSFADNPQARQKQIVEMAKNQGEISLQQIQENFPQVTSRTIRRDMSALVKKDVLKRRRESKKDIYFTFKGKSESGQG